MKSKLLIVACCMVWQAYASSWQLPNHHQALHKLSPKLGYRLIDNRNLYVCLATLWGHQQLGVTWSYHKKCELPYAGKIYAVDKFMVLNIKQPSWQKGEPKLPSKAFLLGSAGTHKIPFALCRGYYKGSLLIGKTWQGHSYCEAPYQKKVLKLKQYDVIVINTPLKKSNS